MKAFSFVEKSALPKNYVLDYLVLMRGYPVCIVEAKSPDAAQQAIDEARVYAQLLNQNFPTKINPVGRCRYGFPLEHAQASAAAPRPPCCRSTCKLL